LFIKRGWKENKMIKYVLYKKCEKDDGYIKREKKNNAKKDKIKIK